MGTISLAGCAIWRRKCVLPCSHRQEVIHTHLATKSPAPHPTQLIGPATRINANRFRSLRLIHANRNIRVRKFSCIYIPLHKGPPLNQSPRVAAIAHDLNQTRHLPFNPQSDPELTG
jgi:hypothetical protein